MEPVKVGVVGIGNMGVHHARVYSQLPQTELVGVVDIDEKRGGEVAKEFKTNFLTDFQQLYDLGVQAVNIVVPTVLHFPLAVDFLRSGVHVLVEKPITADLIQAKKLIDVAKENHCILQVGHLERFNPAVKRLKEVIDVPVTIETKRVSYKTDRNLDVGVVWDLMIHDLDILLHLVECPVVEVSAMGVSVYSDYEDIVFVQLLFQNGVVANLMASRLGGERQRSLKVVEHCGKSLELDFINQTLNTLSAPDAGIENIVDVVPVDKGEPLRLELEHFADCVANHKTPLVSGEDGKKALELAIQVVAKMRLVKLNSAQAEKLVGKNS